MFTWKNTINEGQVKELLKGMKEEDMLKSSRDKMEELEKLKELLKD